MEYLRIIILGIVQGITEFLPISSDGHLVVADKLIERFSSVPLSNAEYRRDDHPAFGNAGRDLDRLLAADLAFADQGSAA